MDGLQRRPNLVYPTHTMIELAHQALVHKEAFALKVATASGQPSRARSVRSEQWRWQPIYKCMPPPRWHANPDKINEAVNQMPRRRLTHKRPWQAHCPGLRGDAPQAAAGVHVYAGESEGLASSAKRRRVGPSPCGSGRLAVCLMSDE